MIRSPPVAIAWDLYRRHRWGLWAIFVYVIAVSVFGSVEYTEANTDRMAWTLMVPLGSSYFFLLAMFSMGLAGDVATRGSMYPARVFTLPVSNAALAGWPMLFGTVTVAVLWLVTATLVPWPSSAYVPTIWPALFLAAFLAWTQVILWLPYPVQGLRMLVALVWLSGLGIWGLHSIHHQPPDALMVALFAPQLPLAFLLARYAVGRARCGDIPDWRGVIALPGRVAEGGRSRQYSSAFQAQVAYEWGQYGWSLPMWIAILLPVSLALLFIVERLELVLLVLLIVLLSPPVMAAFVSASVHRADPRGRDGQGMATLQATRPMTSAAQVGAKLTATAASALVAWMLVFIAVPTALLLSDNWSLVAARVVRVNDAIGTARGVALPALLIAGLMVATWKLLVQSLYVGLSGRAWLIRVYIGLALAALVAIVPLFFWIRENAALDALIYSATPWRWGLAVLLGLKMAVVIWAVLRLQRAQLLDARVLLRCAVVWLAAVFSLYGVFVWLLDTPQIPGDILMAIAILAIPLARLSAAPMALDWNRHRW